MTVEPGLYFIDSEMDKILKDPSLSKFANVDRLNQVGVLSCSDYNF